MRSLCLLLPFAASLAGCATVPPAPPPVAAATPLPAAPAFAGYGTLAVPPRLADGSYATPNRGVSAAGAIWHLRAGLNVAALACRDADEAATAAAYNAFLSSHRAAFADAYRTLGAEYGTTAAFDAAMTALYNYYALPPARPGLCLAARRILAETALLPAGALPGFAPNALARLDAPYTTVFAAQEAWLAGRAAPATIAASVPAAAPRLTVDPAVLRMAGSAGRPIVLSATLRTKGDGRLAARR